ncbi:MAG: hypothetical protein WDZ59_06740 [Pirellulales bacterium]
MVVKVRPPDSRFERRRWPAGRSVWLLAVATAMMPGCATWAGSPLDTDSQVVESAEAPPPSFRGESADGHATGFSSEARDIERRLGYK